MSLQMWGALLGAVAGAGALLVATRVLAMRRADLATRVLPYLRDVPEVMQPVRAGHDGPSGAARSVFGPLLRHAAARLEQVLGGATSVRRRIERAGLDLSVTDFRIEQVVWGLVAFGVAAAVSVVEALRAPGGTLPLVGLCLLAFVGGVLLRDNRLSATVREHERRVLLEFPVIAELLALAVAAGESPVAALDRVAHRSRGALSVELATVLAQVRTGAPVGRAFDGLAARTGVPLVARFAEGVAVAVERGTPLADVLHAQAADVREAGRRALIEAGARKEVLMMVPVVFLILPVTIVYAFWPGLIGLRLVAP